MNYAEIKQCDIANGSGVRTTLFVSGCRRHCPFCFNESAWRFDAGTPFTEKTEQEILDSLAPFYVDGLSVLGGEPMEPENQEALVGFLERVRAAYPDKTIWLYSGFTYEELAGTDPVHAPYRESPRTDATDRILAAIDVLVDGPFVQDLKDITLRFRGSSNQRLLDMKRTLAAGEATLWRDDPIFETHTM